ncbi:PTS sugar transporter subunit IIB [Clostridium zeae]|uniref:PTS sugar transporter subunit IIB n=1 Tax=Clostridium zeae TaxID=2759022 RepID=A0ABQ1EFA9_9CLOT|nr:PTS sugar transporter subunit IIB [Clostridium zeae]GFZ33512.1 PTS sugar transporter subunit IIB [Clostridium zeae]
MKRILIVCAAGMSTSLLVNKMMSAANDRNIDIEIFALPISKCANVGSTVDAVLLGPQVKFLKGQVDKIIKGRVPVVVIDMKDYSMMDGKVVLDKTLALLK